MNERTRHLVGFTLLTLSTATLLTNAYYLEFAEPAVSRKALAVAVIVLTGMWVAATRLRLPADPKAHQALARRTQTATLVAAILMVAFALRYDGIKSGLPQSYTPDEYDYVHSYLTMIKRGDMNPRWWHHPSVQPYVNVGTFLTVYFMQAGSGRWRNIHAIQVEDMLFWGRLGAGVIPGTLAVLLTFSLARRVFSTRVGLVAAALLAVAPGVVEVSQYNKPDSLLVLFSTVSVLVTMLYLDRGGSRLALGAGLALGFSAAVKYNSALLLVPFMGAMLFRHGFSVLSRSDLYAGAAGTVLGFFVGCPYFYADLARFLEHVGAGIHSYGYAGLDGASGSNNWLNHANYTINYGAGWLFFLFGVGGLGLALYRIDRRVCVFLTYPILYYSFYSSQKINFAGNLMPVYPFLAILAAFGLIGLVGLVSRALAKRVRVRAFAPALLVAALTAVMWFPTSMSLRRNRLVTLPDTGSAAALWIESRYPEGTHFASERQTPVLDRNRYKLTEESVLARRSLDDYRDSGVEYLIVSSTVYERFGAESQRGRTYQRLFSICPLEKEFAAEAGRLFGPTIRILKVPE